MHRLLLDVHDSRQVDHKDNDSQNNQKSNLRICSRGQNRANSGPNINGSSQFKGVGFLRGKWQAQIGKSGKTHYLGCFDSESEAAKAYDRAAKIYHGEFAKLNFPGDQL